MNRRKRKHHVGFRALELVLIRHDGKLSRSRLGQVVRGGKARVRVVGGLGALNRADLPECGEFDARSFPTTRHHWPYDGVEYAHPGPRRFYGVEYNYGVVRLTPKSLAESWYYLPDCDRRALLDLLCLTRPTLPARPRRKRAPEDQLLTLLSNASPWEAARQVLRDQFEAEQGQNATNPSRLTAATTGRIEP